MALWGEIGAGDKVSRSVGPGQGSPYLFGMWRFKNESLNKDTQPWMALCYRKQRNSHQAPPFLLDTDCLPSLAVFWVPDTHICICSLQHDLYPAQSVQSPFLFSLPFLSGLGKCHSTMDPRFGEWVPGVVSHTHFPTLRTAPAPPHQQARLSMLLPLVVCL